MAANPLSSYREKRILTNLYEVTNGAGWKRKGGWTDADSLADWDGVETDSRGFVIRLHLFDNGLQGTIPDLTGLTKLKTLSLYRNRLTGPIPATIGNLSQLQEFHVFDNELTGPIPAELDDLKDLRWLNIANNQLEGKLPPELGDLAALTSLFVSGNPGLAGELPSALRSLSLERFHYDCTNLRVPDEEGFREWLRGIEDHRGTEVSDREALTILYETTGGLGWRQQGNWGRPAPLAEWSGVTTDTGGRVVGLRLSGNKLQGALPCQLMHLTQLEELRLDGNLLRGDIPDLRRLRNLRVLHLRGNRLSGPVPVWLGGLTNLEELNLSWNELTGTIPPELGKLSELTKIALGNNNGLGGALPPELGNLSKLRAMWLRNTALAGPLPLSLRNLNNLRRFYYRDTQLSVPDDPAFREWLRGVPEHVGTDQ